MGWSCSKKAGDVLDKITDACYAKTGISNVYTSRGNKYFFEGSRKEHSDGAITGVIWKYTSETHVRKAGSFRINGDGTIARMPKGMREVGGI